MLDKIKRLQTIVELRNEGLTWNEIDAELGFKKGTVRRFVEHNDPALLQEKVLNATKIARLQAIVELRNEGMHWYKIDIQLGLVRGATYQFVSRYKPELLQKKILTTNQLTRLQSIAEFRNEGLIWKEIAVRLNEPLQNIYTFAARHMPDLLKEKVLNDTQIEKLQAITQYRKNGLTWQKIADKFGTTKQAVQQYAAINLPKTDKTDLNE